jgi:hypothetical protein
MTDLVPMKPDSTLQRYTQQYSNFSGLLTLHSSVFHFPVIGGLLSLALSLRLQPSTFL